ncbi:Rieske 2Fe-2S domain-containing protein [Noviherbaspirillum saxi]|uniref:cholesterol 7-desaturase n=1 Tax=Noviherbaspirillum saxi TaxID=2320863 RepID=A0A3A3FF66_9BURK|nr:Rieske 2Fe-2S domain-containing protein [Noviherbaspirillum saxi]RJF91687.1 Rieske (2Fe-2S) protein [Noviherbaspirillum saxi]
MIHESLSMKLTGWFQVGWSADLSVGTVKPLRYFGEDLVAFRCKAGKVRIMEAHCKHLGAHLGHGGCVVDQGIQCPFHGWVWGTDGRNALIPYKEGSINRTRQLKVWHVAEKNDCIYLWHDAKGRNPLWEVPDAFKDFGAHVKRFHFEPPGPEARSHWPNLHLHPQMLIENIVDPHHFKYTHLTKDSPKVLSEEIGKWEWRATVGFGRRWAQGLMPPTETLNTIIIHWSGPGISINVEHTPAGMRVVCINSTPVDDDSAEIFATYWINRTEDDAQSYAARLDEAKIALPQDVNIWHNQRFNPNPALTAEEWPGWRKARTWTKRFNPDATQEDENWLPEQPANT